MSRRRRHVLIYDLCEPSCMSMARSLFRCLYGYVHMSLWLCLHLLKKLFCYWAMGLYTRYDTRIDYWFIWSYPLLFRCHRLKTFPPYLLMHMRKFTISENWTPTKLSTSRYPLPVSLPPPCLAIPSLTLVSLHPPHPVSLSPLPLPSHSIIRLALLLHSRLPLLQSCLLQISH